MLSYYFTFTYYSTYANEHYRTCINTENRDRIISFYCELLTIYHGSVTLVQLKNFTVRTVPWEIVNDSRDEKTFLYLPRRHHADLIQFSSPLFIVLKNHTHI